jgi:hypothetical protein
MAELGATARRCNNLVSPADKIQIGARSWFSQRIDVLFLAPR